MAVIAAVVVVAKLAVLVLGLLVVRLAYRAYRRTGSRSLRSLTIAFGCITLGAILGGVVHQLLDVGLVTGVLVNSALTAVGFVVLVHSLYVIESAPAKAAPAKD